MANEISRKLRKNMTRHEVRLWLRLRELRKLGFISDDRHPSKVSSSTSPVTTQESSLSSMAVSIRVGQELRTRRAT